MKRIQEGADYATEVKVHKDQKIENKGKEWCVAAQSIKKAFQEIKAETKKADAAGEMRPPPKVRKKTILNRAKMLGEAMVDNLRSGYFFEAFTNAGRRMESSLDLQAEYDDAFNPYVDDPHKRERKGIGRGRNQVL